MLRTNKNRLSFASLSIKPQSALLDDPYHTSTLHFEKILTASELEPMSIYQSSTREKQRTKVLKLIGDKQKNICEIVEGFHCVCGWRAEFKNIVDLFMDKIYRLREQRNQLREELAFLQYTPRKEEGRKQFQDIGTNTEQVQDLGYFKDQLKSFTFESEATINKKEHLMSVNTEQIEELFGSGFNLDRGSSRCNQTNLLQSSLKSQANEGECEDAASFFKQAKILQEHDTNSDNKFKQFSFFLQRNHINLNKLQKYIEKVNCAKQLDKYDENKRNRNLF